MNGKVTRCIELLGVATLFLASKGLLKEYDRFKKEVERLPGDQEP